jgi:hypothetical protein
MRAAQVVVAIVTIVLILTLGFQAALFLLLFLVVCYALAALAVLITVRTSMRLEDSPTMAPMPFDDPSIPDVARAPLDANHKALVALGFTRRDMVLLPQRTTPGGYLALYRHAGIPASAFSRVLLKPGKGPPALLSSEVEFEVTYDNGTIAELSNVVNPALAIDKVAGVAVQLPQVTDVTPLFHYFQKLVAKYERDTGLTERSRIPLPDDTTAASLFEYQLARGHAIQHAAGLLYATDKPGVWRPTWRTSFQIAGGAISPFSEMIKRRKLDRGERIRRELDLSS